MKILSTYQDIHIADLDRQLLELEDITVTLVSSNGRIIERLIDYENFGENLSYSLYVEDDTFARALKIFSKIDKKRKHSDYYKIYLIPLTLTIVTWIISAQLTNTTREILKSLRVSIKYTGAIVYAVMFVVEASNFIETWYRPNNKYRKTEIGKVEIKRDTKSLITNFIIATVLFLITYFIF